MYLVGHYVPRCAKVLRFNALRFALRIGLPCLFRPLVACSVGRGAFFWQYPAVSAIKDKKRHKKRTCQKRGMMVCGWFSLIGVLVGVGVVGVSPLVIEAIYSNQPRRDITKKRHYHHPQRGNTRNLYFFCRLADIWNFSAWLLRYCPYLCGVIGRDGKTSWQAHQKNGEKKRQTFIKLKCRLGDKKSLKNVWQYQKVVVLLWGNWKAKKFIVFKCWSFINILLTK